jgi:hypothetical protein
MKATCLVKPRVGAMTEPDRPTFDAITEPSQLWTPAELRGRASPVPKAAGVYGWWFREIPCDTDVAGCIRRDDLTLLYIGISPGRAGSASNLRTRTLQVCRDRGGHTLRRSLAALLAAQLDLRPSPANARGRLHIDDEGERRLSAWITSNAAGCGKGADPQAEPSAQLGGEQKPPVLAEAHRVASCGAGAGAGS